jgi:hypothetical protein
MLVLTTSMEQIMNTTPNFPMFSQIPSQAPSHSVRRAARKLLAGLGLCAICVGGALSGCTTRPPRSHVFLVDPTPAPAALAKTDGELLRLSSLGAGDPLGWQIHSNDVYLAYLQQSGQTPVLTSVTDGE